MSKKGPPGLTAQIKDKLIQQALERRLRQTEQVNETLPPVINKTDNRSNIPEHFYRFN